MHRKICEPKKEHKFSYRVVKMITCLSSGLASTAHRAISWCESNGTIWRPKCGPQYRRRLPYLTCDYHTCSDAIPFLNKTITKTLFSTNNVDKQFKKFYTTNPEYLIYDNKLTYVSI